MSIVKFVVLICIIQITAGFQIKSKDRIVDEVVAVVGNEPILLSDIERQVIQYKAQNPNKTNDNNIRCQIIEQLLKQKLFLNQAQKDTIEATSAQVDQILSRRLNYIIRQIGSPKKLEQYYGKSLSEIRQDLREKVKNQLVMQQVQQKVIGSVNVSWEEVKQYYKSMPTDSFPVIPKKYKIQEIVISPSYSEAAKLRARKRLLELRERIMKGEEFSTLAVLYSDDQQSAQNGGELGMHTRDELPDEMAEAAFKLKEGEVSNIIHSKYGYHIIKLVNKEGDRVNLRHILKKPQVSTSEQQNAIEQLKHIRFLIRNDSITFAEAARKYSEGKKSKLQGGVMINPQNATTKFTPEQLPPPERYRLEDLNKGEISDPFKTQDRQGQTLYKIIKIKEVYPKHKANLESDYNRIHELAKKHKKQEILNNWLREKRENTYIHIKEQFKTCDFKLDGWK